MKITMREDLLCDLSAHRLVMVYLKLALFYLFLGLLKQLGHSGDFFLVLKGQLPRYLFGVSCRVRYVQQLSKVKLTLLLNIAL